MLSILYCTDWYDRYLSYRSMNWYINNPWNVLVKILIDTGRYQMYWQISAVPGEKWKPAPDLKITHLVGRRPCSLCFFPFVCFSFLPFLYGLVCSFFSFLLYIFFLPSFMWPLVPPCVAFSNFNEPLSTIVPLPAHSPQLFVKILCDNVIYILCDLFNYYLFVKHLFIYYIGT